MTDPTIHTLGLPELLAILPQILLSLTTLLLLLQIAFYRHLQFSLYVFVFGSFCSFLSTFWIPKEIRISDVLHIHSNGIFWMQLILLCSIPIALLFYDFLKQQSIQKEEMYVLLSISLMGAITIPISNHFVTVFLGLELLSIPTYAMIGYAHRQKDAVEAALKYLTLSAVSSALILFGISMLYAWSGTLQFDQITQTFDALLLENRHLFLVGLVFFTSGIAFKLALFPFHMWAPDIYEGTSAAMACYITTISKSAVLGMFLQFISQIDLSASQETRWMLSIFCIISMLGGSFLSLFQRNIKRLFAYSSTTHMGLVLSTFLLSRMHVFQVLSFFMIAYTVTSLIAFGILSILEIKGCARPYLEDIRSFFKQHPWLSLAFSFALLSLMGFPLTAGFYAKWIVLLEIIRIQDKLLFMSILLSSAISIYAYMRLIIAMYIHPIAPTNEHKLHCFFYPSHAVISSCFAVLIIIAIFPSFFM